MSKLQESKVHAMASLIAMYPILILSLATLIFTLLNSELWLFTFIGTIYFITFRNIDQIREAHLKKHLPNW